MAHASASRHDRLRVFYLAHWLTFVALIAAALWWWASQVLTSKAVAINSSLVVFLCILPLVNAVFDWLSLGATRFFLRRAEHAA